MDSVLERARILLSENHQSRERARARSAITDGSTAYQSSSQVERAVHPQQLVRAHCQPLEMGSSTWRRGGG